MARTTSLFLLFSPVFAAAQLMSDQDAKDQMKYDVQYLASDQLEGREAGTKGERMAADYLVQKFGGMGLMPYGDSTTYLQKFTFAAPPVAGPKCHLQLGRKILKPGEDFYPIDLSATSQVRGKVMKCGYGIAAPELNYNDFDGLQLKDRCAAISIGSPDGIHPHSKYLAHHDLRGRIEKAIELGAVAVILYNDDATAEPPSQEMSPKVQPVSVPVVFLKGDKAKDMLLDGDPVVINMDIVREQRTAMNVVGMVDNGKPDVVVIGAHFDHLGYGGEGSLYVGDPAIHNGADDNASGVATMMQIARDLREMDEARGNDYLFIAFSGEEKGLYGSNWWTKHPTVPLDRITYMINLDMVGRLDTLRHLAIYGTGTSPKWDSVLTVLRRPARPKDRRDPAPVDTFTIKMNPEGVGPSDHTSFYLQDIPVLHFFTGQHADYHKPSDDEDKINYAGMLDVARFIEHVITAVNAGPKLAFTKTADADTASAPRFTVTMGVMPDYMFSGKGMAIDGVHEGKPAANAGLKKGDVVIKLGDVEVSDMNSYMKALGMLKKGDRTKVTVLRDGRELTNDIQF
jgi:hypothetical protein